MSTYDAIQSAFNAGEVSGAFAGRIDSDAYRRALSLCKNWRPRPQGSVLMRGGSQKLASVPGGRRVINFRSKSGEDFEVVLSDKVLQVFSAAGALPLGAVGGGQQDLVQNGMFDQGLVGWQTGGARDPVFNGQTVLYPEVVDGAVNLPAPYPSPPYNDQHAFISQLRGPIANGAKSAVFAFDQLLPTGLLSSTVRVLVCAGNQYFQDQVLVDTTLVGTGRRTIPVPIDLITGGADGAWISFKIEASATKLRIDNVALTVTTDASGDGQGLSLPAPWTADQLAAVQFEEEPGTDRLHFAHRKIAPYVLERTSPTAWNFAVTPLLNTQADMVSTEYPEALAIFQGRLWYARDNNIWASKAGSLYDFSLGTSTPKDGLYEKAATKGAIKWLRGKDVLIAGTDLSAVVISSSTGLIVPGDFQVKEEVGYAVAPVRSVLAGPLMPYVTIDRRKVRAIDYNLGRQSWQAQDITFLAEHIAKDGIGELHFSHDLNLLVDVSQGGDLRLCVFDPEQNFVAWWRAPISGGSVLSASVGRDGAYEWLWMLVARPAGVFLERIPLFDTDEVNYLDGHLKIIAAAGQTSIAGFGHLYPGQARVLVNGEMLGDFAVAADGTITLPDPLAANDVVVAGLAYRATGITLKPEGGNPAGTSQAMVAQRPHIIARVNDSALPLINGQRAAPLTFSANGVDESTRITDDVEVRNLGTDSPITIEQDLPFRTEVCALFGRVNQGKV